MPLMAVFGSVSEEDLELALEMVVNDAVEEVMNSTNLQPSVPGIVCEVISDIVQSISKCDDVTTKDSLNGNVAYSNALSAQLVPHNTQVCASHLIMHRTNGHYRTPNPSLLVH